MTKTGEFELQSCDMFVKKWTTNILENKLQTISLPITLKLSFSMIFCKKAVDKDRGATPSAREDGLEVWST